MNYNGQVATDGWNGQEFFLVFNAIFGSLKFVTDTLKSMSSSLHHLSKMQSHSADGSPHHHQFASIP